MSKINCWSKPDIIKYVLQILNGKIWFWPTVYFRHFLLGGLRVNCSVNVENYFHILLYVIHVTLNLLLSNHNCLSRVKVFVYQWCDWRICTSVSWTKLDWGRDIVTLVPISNYRCLNNLNQTRFRYNICIHDDEIP